MILLRLMVVYAAISPVLSLLWSNSSYFPIVMLMKVVISLNLAFFLLSLIVLSRYFLLNKLKQTNLLYFGLFLLFFDVIGLVVGVLNGYEDKVISDFYLLINGVILSYAVYISQPNIKVIERFIKIISKVFLFSFFLSILVMQIESIYGIAHYPAIAANMAIIPLLYYLQKKEYKMAGFVFLMIVLSGKRSVLIIIMALLPFIILLLRGVKLARIFSIGFIISVVVLFLSLHSLKLLEENQNILPFGVSVVNKLSLINPMSESFDFIGASGERFEEVIQGVSQSHENPNSFVFGSGNGFTYQLEVGRKDMIQDDRHSIHFAPADYYTKNGIVFAIIVTIVIIIYIFNILRYFRYSNHTLNTLLSYQLFTFLYSLIGANYGLDYLFWISIALGLVIVKNIKKQEVCNVRNYRV
jgi:hypothetical protein